MESNQMQQAIRSFQDAIRLDPTMAGAHVNLGAIHNKLGRYVEAIKAAQDGLKLNPKSAAGHYQLAVAYLKSGQPQLARREHRLLEPLSPELAKELQLLLPK